MPYTRIGYFWFWSLREYLWSILVSTNTYHIHCWKIIKSLNACRLMQIDCYAWQYQLLECVSVTTILYKRGSKLKYHKINYRICCWETWWLWAAFARVIHSIFFPESTEWHSVQMNVSQFKQIFIHSVLP